MKSFKIIFIVLFFGILSIPLLGLFWYEEPETTENKELTNIPSITEDNKLNINFLKELNDYFSDHFAYRQELVTANAVISSGLFQESSEDLAIVGTDGWLYLKVSLEDYQRTKHMSERGLNNVATTLYLMQEYVESMGKQFVFTCAPNKNTLYPEHMPYYYTKSEEPHDIDRLVPYLQDKNITYVDLKTMFEEESRVLYHKGDSHWNNLGAAMVQDELLTYIGKEHTDFEQLEPKIRDDFQGDIDKILYPMNRHLEEEYDYSEYMSYEFVDETNVEAPKLATHCEGKTGRLLCFRDSYLNSLLQFLADEFEDAYFVKSLPYHLDQMYYDNYDVCMLEIVERNLSYIKTFAPVMPAPLRAFAEETQDYQSLKTSCTYELKNPYYKLVGTVDEKVVADDSPIYLRFTGDSAQFVVEASPVTEPSDDGKTQEETLAEDYGYVAYISPMAFPEGEYTMEVITRSDAWYQYTADQTILFGQGE